MKRIGADTIRCIKQKRRRGFSIPEISKAYDISRSTVFRYVRNVPIDKRYKKRWLSRRNASKIISRKNWEIAGRLTRPFITRISQKEYALFATALYWAEGSKKDFSFCNGDPKMVALFIHVLRNIFNIHNNDLKISLRIYEDVDIKECMGFWSKIVGFTLTLKNISINVLHGRKKGKLPHGMCRVRVRKGGLLLKKIFCIINGVIGQTPL